LGLEVVPFELIKWAILDEKTEQMERSCEGRQPQLRGSADLLVGSREHLGQELRRTLVNLASRMSTNDLLLCSKSDDSRAVRNPRLGLFKLAREDKAPAVAVGRV
jgi:hypothetical protein